jgi:integrase
MHAQRLAEATRSRPLRRLRKDVAGIEDVHVHVLRHYAASQRHRLAMDNKLRSVVIGHADERVTNEIYTQVDEATLEAIASKIDPLASALGSV